MIIGITGGSGCGKTTLLDQIREQGGLVLDCDAIYHRLTCTDGEMLSAIEATFPGTVKNGKLFRKKLGNIVFSDESALTQLNQITHRAVKAEVIRALETKPRLAAIDAIGLFESGLAELCDVTVCVLAPEEARIVRLMGRDGICKAYAVKRIKAQHTDQWFREKCDEILVNDTDIDSFRGKCLAFLRRFDIIKPE